MVEIPLTQGKVAIIDAEDFDRVSKFSWYASKNRKKFYAKSDGGQRVSMHRLIMGEPKGMVVDHVNGDTLDNRKQNLRIVTRGQNSRHRADEDLFCKSGYYGVIVTITARISVDGKRVYLGAFKTLEAAAEAYDRAHAKYFPDKKPPNGFIE